MFCRDGAMTRARDDGQIQCHYGNACRVLSHRSKYTPTYIQIIHAQITYVDLRRHSMAESAYKTRSTTSRRRLIKRNAYLWRHNAYIRVGFANGRRRVYVYVCERKDCGWLGRREKRRQCTLDVSGCSVRRHKSQWRIL